MANGSKPPGWKPGDQGNDPHNPSPAQPGQEQEKQPEPEKKAE